MAYITQSYIEAFLGSEVLTELFTDDGAYNSNHVNTVIEAAESRVKQALKAAGYTPPSTTTTDGVIKQATLGQFIIMAYNRPTKSLEIPTTFRQYIGVMQALYEGTIRPETLTPDELAGVGGIRVKRRNADGDELKSVFSRDDLAGY